jgi:hypothetical protein
MKFATYVVLAVAATAEATVSRNLKGRGKGLQCGTFNKNVDECPGSCTKCWNPEGNKEVCVDPEDAPTDCGLGPGRDLKGKGRACGTYRNALESCPTDNGCVRCMNPDMKKEVCVDEAEEDTDCASRRALEEFIRELNGKGKGKGKGEACGTYRNNPTACETIEGCVSCWNPGMTKMVCVSEADEATDCYGSE